MKGRVIFCFAACFISPSLLLGMLTDWFQNPVNLPYIILCLVCLLLESFVWYRHAYLPMRKGKHAIQRALKGDYKARIPSHGKSESKEFAAVFNRLMDRMEGQTKEFLENKRLENQLHENERIYRTALELTCVCVYEADLTHNRFMNGLETCRRSFPFLKTDIYDEMVKSVSKKAIYKEDRERFLQTFARQNLLETFQKKGSSEITLEYRRVMPDGQILWESSTVILLNSVQNGPRKIIGYIKNIDARKKQDLEILKMSQKDGLTGLYNKKYTQSLIETYLAGEGVEGTHAVIMLDIDNFKGINDTFGHVQGDTALIEVAQVLQDLFRTTDVVGRVGGDEFLLLLKDLNSSQKLQEKLENIRCALKNIRLENPALRISGSIGAAIYPENGISYQELYQKADTALYYAKEHGKDQFCIYENPHAAGVVCRG